MNIVDPAVAVITSIDLDHRSLAGRLRGAIAREKAGILRRAVPTVIADPDPPPELSACVAKVGAVPVFRLGSEIVVARERGTWSARLRQANGETRQLAPRPAAALLPENICAAVQAALLLNIDLSDDCLSRALDRSAPAGRREVLHVDGRQYVLDVAHNPAAVTKLLEYLNVMPCNGRTFCLFSVMSDKDIQAMTDLAAGSFDGWYLADQPDNKRAARAVDIAVLLEGAGQRVMRISDNLQQAFRQAQGVLAAGDRLVVFGSFYTVAVYCRYWTGKINSVRRPR
ncbi:MAG: cyanophycin synthetase [Halioglobus sp.]